MFFYGHPQNRFWRVVSAILGCKTPKTVEEKKEMLLDAKIALWDVIAECDINGSADSSIKSERANDISPILAVADIKMIFTNGKKAHELYEKLIYPSIDRNAICLPSTSPANAVWTIDRLIAEWSIIKKYV